VRRNPLPVGAIALTVEAAGSGRKLSYKFADSGLRAKNTERRAGSA
jgi:hypothetical protein